MDTVRLYNIPPSFFSQIARLALAEKGVEWDDRWVDIGPSMHNYEPWYIRINSRAVIPTLEHNGKFITDTLRIVHYINDTFPGPPLVPDDPDERARMEAWLEQLNTFQVRELSYDTESHPILRRFLPYTYKLRRRRLQHHKQRNPDLSELYQLRLDDIDRWEATSQDEEQIKLIKHQLALLLQQLQQDLEEYNGPWCTGPHYSLADIYWTVLLARLTMLKLSTMWDDLPLVQEYFQRLQARPSFAQADIWLRFKLRVMLHLAAPLLLPWVFGGVLLLAVLSYVVWTILGWINV